MKTFWLSIKKISGIISTILETNCVRFSVDLINSQMLEVKGSRFQVVGLEETIW